MTPGRSRRLARSVRWALAAAIAVNAALLAAIGVALAVPLPDRRADWSAAIEYRDGTPAYVFLSRDDKWRLPVALDEVDPALVGALVALEDQRFWSHDGVDPIAIVRAAASDLVARAPGVGRLDPDRCSWRGCSSPGRARCRAS